MKKICIINQPEGLGDILYTQKIGYNFEKDGYKIFWPVNKAYPTIGNYLQNFNYFNLYQDHEKDFVKAGLPQECYDTYLKYNGRKGIIHEEKFGDFLIKFVPLNHLQHVKAKDPEIMPNPGLIMKKKYSFVGVSDNDWKDYLHIKRNTEKENELFYEKLDLKDGDEYALINNNFGTPGMGTVWSFIEKDFESSDSFKKGLKKIKLDYTPGFTLFDWMKVIENAKEIWQEGSAMTYICEKLKLKAEKLFMYSRTGFGTPEMHNLFSQPWYFFDRSHGKHSPLSLINHE